jgi:hypothetical protein
MIGKDITLSAELEQPNGVARMIVRGNYQQCYYQGYQEKSATRVGMRNHLEQSHNGRDPPLDLSPWNIIIDHLKHDENVSLTGLFERE